MWAWVKGGRVEGGGEGMGVYSGDGCVGGEG